MVHMVSVGLGMIVPDFRGDVCHLSSSDFVLCDFFSFQVLGDFAKIWYGMRHLGSLFGGCPLDRPVYNLSQEAICGACCPQLPFPYCPLLSGGSPVDIVWVFVSLQKGETWRFFVRFLWGLVWGSISGLVPVV